MFERVAKDSFIMPAWLSVRQVCAEADHTFTDGVVQAIQALFLEGYADGARSPGELTREYRAGQQEYLQVLDSDAIPARPSRTVLNGVAQYAEQYPGWQEWLLLTEAGNLLAARWLCHWAGLRHATVELFLDPPQRAGYTFIQVRSMDKFEAPGAFDIPCAGHITALDDVPGSLAKELGEELNLSIADLEGLQLLTRYESKPIQTADETWCGWNIEYRFLFRARLREESLARVQFRDGEVAGLGIFAWDEMRRLVEQYPERVASGLRDALSYYRAHGYE